MDRHTLLTSRSFWTTEPSPTTRTLTRLTADERALYEELVECGHGDAMRLEQERVVFSAVMDVLREHLQVGNQPNGCEPLDSRA